jgi:FG-GAP repeat
MTGEWWVLRSSSNSTTYFMYVWGLSADVPTPGDYDGDGMTDLAVYRPSTGTSFILSSSSQYTAVTMVNWGGSGDVAVLARR